MSCNKEINYLLTILFTGVNVKVDHKEEQVLFCYTKKALFFTKAILLCWLLFSSVKTNAQTTIDSADENTVEDTTSTHHGYDTTGYYFNWKNDVNDLFTDKKINIHVSSDSTVQKLKSEEDFWYVNSIEDFKKNEVRLQYDKQFRDSLIKAGIIKPDEQVFTQEESNAPWYQQQWVSTLIWCIIIAIFLFAVVYFLLANKISLFNYSSTKKRQN